MPAKETTSDANRTRITSRLITPRSLATHAILALALALAGCGATTPTSGSTLAPTQEATTVSAPATATTQPPAPMASLASCAPTNQQATDVGTPTFVLTPTTPGRTVSVHVGDTVQVRLPSTSRWSFQARSAAAVLTAIAPSSAYAPSLNACVWTFQAKAIGAETLSYGGAPICKPGQACATYRIAMDFTVNVSN